MLMHAATVILTRWVMARSDQTVFISRNVMEYFRRVRFARPPSSSPTALTEACFPLLGSDSAHAREALGLAIAQSCCSSDDSSREGAPAPPGFGPAASGMDLALCRPGAARPVQLGPATRPQRGYGGPGGTRLLLPGGRPTLAPLLRRGFPARRAGGYGLRDTGGDPAGDPRAMPGIGGVSLVVDLSLEAVSLVLTQTLADPNQRARLAASAARFAAENFDWDACVDRYLEILGTLRRTADKDPGRSRSAFP